MSKDLHNKATEIVKKEHQETVEAIIYKTIDPDKVFNPSFSTPRTPPRPRELKIRCSESSGEAEQSGSNPSETESGNLAPNPLIVKTEKTRSEIEVEEEKEKHSEKEKNKRRKEKELNLYKLNIEDYYPQNAVINRIKDAYSREVHMKDAYSREAYIKDAYIRNIYKREDTRNWLENNLKPYDSRESSYGYGNIK